VNAAPICCSTPAPRAHGAAVSGRDIIDVWNMRRDFYWPQLHNNVLRTLLGKAKHGPHHLRARKP